MLEFCLFVPLSCETWFAYLFEGFFERGCVRSSHWVLSKHIALYG